MHSLIRKIISLDIGWNERLLSQADFYRLCRREKIKVEEIPLKVPGFYMVCKGERFIVLDSHLRGVRWLHVAFHELAHHYFHAPTSAASVNFFQIQESSKVKFEAEAFAVVALIPEPSLRRMLSEGIAEVSDYTKEMIEFRLKILELYGV